MSGFLDAPLVEADGYQIQRSLRFRNSAASYLNKSVTVAGNQTTFTYSFWVKRGSIAASGLFSVQADIGAAPFARLWFNANNELQLTETTTGSVLLYDIRTVPVFRDCAAWYHIVAIYDSTNATSSDRIRLYVNGLRITSLNVATYPTLNQTSGLRAATVQHIGKLAVNESQYCLDGYLAEVNFIDGQALTPSSFGQTDSATGQWVAKKYAGTYGTNGFYLDFKDPTNTTTLCADKSGNGNNWTANGISLTAGATYDSMLDVPAGNGGRESGNYATLSPIDNTFSGNTLSNGNLRATTPVNSPYAPAKASIGMATGKWYWECVDSSGSGASAAIFGIVQGINANDYLGNQSLSVGYNGSTGGVAKNTVTITTVSAFNQGDIIGFGFDADALTLAIYKNNSLLTTVTSITAGTWFAAVGDGTSIGGGYLLDINFGQRPFAYTPPTGFKALHTGNLPTPAIANPKKHFDVLTWIGDGATPKSRGGLQFQPDLVWAKDRSTATNHALFDSVRGTGAAKVLNSDTTLAERGDGAAVTSFDAGGFTTSVGSVNHSWLNNNAEAYVAWNWKAGGAAVTNNAGSLASQVSANPLAGFSIVTYTSTRSASGVDTVGHGLGVAPKLVISKSKNVAGIDSGAWFVHHGAIAVDSYLRLNTTAAVDSVSGGGGVAMVAPTSSVFSAPYISGTSIAGNNYVAYCFAEVPGFSKFGSYTGNGSADGPFVFCGFRPAFVLMKSATVGGTAGYDWYVYDTARNTYNLTTEFLEANYSGSGNQLSDGTFDSTRQIDVLSNGFKVRYAGASHNQSGQTYIFAAFAEAPFKFSNAR